MKFKLTFSTSIKIWVGMSLLVLLAACNANVPSTPEPVSPSPSSTPKPADRFKLAPTRTTSPTKTPTLTPTPTNIPTPTIGPNWQSWYPLREPIHILTHEFSPKEFQDLIIFTSEWATFANTTMHFEDKDTFILFAFSPDGRRAGAISPIEFNASIYLPADPLEKIFMLEYGIAFDHPAIQGLELPPECYPQEGSDRRFFPCSRFQYSPDGQYLGFFYNSSNFGGGGCGDGIMIMDTGTSELVYHHSQANGQIFLFLDDGKVLVKTGHCEGGYLALVDLVNNTERDLGDSGGLYWNVDRSAFAVDVTPHQGVQSSVWGFDLETNRFFMRSPDPIQIDDHPVWTPNNRYLLYQHRTFSLAGEGDYRYPKEFDQARQIILVDAQAGSQRILLSDPDYDFHLGSCFHCAEWYGDWIQVRRVAFTPGNIVTEPWDSETSCRINGHCSDPVELFAFNWRTQELVRWDQAIQAGLVPDLDSIEEPGPDLTQDPVHESSWWRLYPGPDENTMWLDGYGGNPRLIGPDLETNPIYSHPDGLYEYYVGIDGKTLWMVPTEGDPILWVLEGENYFYVPPLPENN